MGFLRFSSIHKRLGVIFLAFLCLLVISVGVTFIGLEMQRQDSRVINLAGRQRMLLQQIRGLALTTRSSETIQATLGAVHAFDQTLMALREGALIWDYTGGRFQPALPSDARLKAELDLLQEKWASYRSSIDQFAYSNDPALVRSAIGQIDSQSGALVEQADRVVRAYEAVLTGKVNRLRTYQLASLIVGLALLSAGWWVTNSSIVRPLTRLENAARQIGEGDLVSSVDVAGPCEVRLLSETMQTMRMQILASRQDLQQWAETLEERVQQRTHELEALSAVSREINSHLSIEEVLTSVTEKSRILLGGDVASLCLLDEDEKVLNLHAAAAPETAIQTNQSPTDHPAAGNILQHHCADTCGLQSRQGFCQIIAPGYRTSHIAAPLYLRGKVIGALCVGGSMPNAFSPETVSVLTQLADAAAVALENSRLYQQAEHIAALEERQRIAAEMHDGLLQTLSFLRLMVGLLDDQIKSGGVEKALSTIQQLRRAEEQGEREIRQAINSLQDDFPLCDTLQDRLSVLARDLSWMHPPVIFESRIMRPLLLSRQESEQVLRVTREAALNAQRHSRSDTIAVILEKSENGVVLSVKDQGIGFVPDVNPDDGRTHFGLKIMQARAARLGGRLSIQSSPGAGTVVQLCWTPSQWVAEETVPA